MTKQRKTLIIWCILLTALIISLFGFLSVLRTENVELVYDEAALSEMRNDEEHSYHTPKEAVPPGIYEIKISYETTEDVSVEVKTNQLSHKTLWYDEGLVLSGKETEKSFTVWLNDRGEDFHIRFRNESGEYSLSSVTIRTAWNSKLYRCFRVFLLLTLLVLLVVLIRNIDRIRKHTDIIVGIALITITASLGLFVRFVPFGHDLNFHLMRIEGLKEAILTGNLPPKVQTNWCFGYGYAVSAMYGDITLVFPALMRVIGFPLQTCYKAFVFLMNLTTALCAYFCFRPFCRKPRYVSLMASFLYTCAPYRLCCIYTRAAFGEYSGMLFLPLIVLGFYHVYNDSPNRKTENKAMLLMAIGFTGLIQTHILSCIMLAMFLLMFALLNWKKTFQKNNLLLLLKSALLTLLLNLWFLIPLIDFMREPLRLHSENGYIPDFQHYGLSLAEVFAQRTSGSASFNWAYLTNLGGRMSMPVGNGFVILLLVYLYYLLTRKTLKKGAGVFALLGCLAVFMATNLFPYDFIERFLPFLSKVITRVNVPYRYLTIAILFFSIFTLLLYCNWEKKKSRKFACILSMIIILISANQSLDYLYGVLNNCPVDTYYDNVKLNTNDLVGYEYLYEGTDYHRIEQEKNIVAEHVELIDYSRRANQFTIMANSTGNDAYLELPLYYYPGYQARNEAKDTLEVVRGENNKLRILLPGNFTGTVYLSYTGKAFWHICEVISLLAVCFVIWYMMKTRKAARERPV